MKYSKNMPGSNEGCRAYITILFPGVCMEDFVGQALTQAKYLDFLLTIWQYI
ncbi:MAG: hypothetical protein ACOCXT_03555 [Candidatus Dojkabacteria bacterium]